MILSENTSLNWNYKKIFNLPKFIIFCFKSRSPLDSKLRYFAIVFGDNFPVSIVNVSVVIYRQVLLTSLDIVKYCATEISKISNSYRQISSEFMTNSIELQICLFIFLFIYF